MRSFYYIRHGQTDWNVEGRFQGKTDIPLNAMGEEQAKHAANLLKDIQFDHIIASPLGRAQHTAAEIHKNQPQAEFSVYQNLHERNFGSFEGRLKAELLKELGFSTLDELRYNPPPDSETVEACRARVVAALEDIWQSYQGQLLIVAHGGIFGRLHEHLIGEPATSENAIPYHFIYENEIWRCEQSPQTTKLNTITS